MPKSKKPKLKKHEIVEYLCSRFDLTEPRAKAIAERYGPSVERCSEAAKTFVRFKALVGGESASGGGD